MALPVLVAHTGYSPYLEFTLRQAAAWAGRDHVVFLGDRANARVNVVRRVDGDAPEFRAAADRVGAVYRHMSTNTAAFELAAIQRWFRLHALMEREGLGRALVLDSDVLLYAGADELADWVGGAEVGLATPAGQPPYGWESSGHSAVWTADRLGAFCDFAVRAYAEPAERERLEAKWRHHLATGDPGGICDMTLFYLFAEAQPPGAVLNVTEARDGAVFDHNAAMTLGAVPGEYPLGPGGLKPVRWRAGRPTVARASGEAVRFLTLHLQGPAKAAIPELYRGPDFPGRVALGRRLARYHRARGLAGRLKYAAWTGLRRALGRAQRAGAPGRRA